MPNLQKIYIVLPVHNRLSTTKSFVNCLKKQTFRNFHLILVDDGSTDGTAEYVKGEINNTTVLEGNGNLWWAGCLHLAYKYLSKLPISDNDIIWINNDDTKLNPDYFEKVFNDPDLTIKTIIVSPGISVSSNYIEYGFSINWPLLLVKKLREGEEPDALTTRGLYMLYSTYKRMGGLHPFLLPQYLSDLEYTIRSKKRGIRMVVSKATQIYVDRKSTGLHQDHSKTLKEYLYNHFISKKTAYNTFYWGNFVLLAAPWKYKWSCFVLVYRRFKKNFLIFYDKIRPRLTNR